jgi:hypothetical protein
VTGVAWHYTIGQWWEKIDSSGILRPATAFVPEGERPAVWFTVRDTYEPTAVKMVKNPDGTVRSLSVEETERLGRGLFRIGVDAKGLLTWDQWKRRSGVARRMADALERVARKQGSDVADWLASFRPISREGWRSVQVRYRGEWTPVSFEAGGQ